jgi:hypothetical protein
LESSFGVIIVCLEVGSDSVRKRIFFFFFLFSLGGLLLPFQFSGEERCFFSLLSLSQGSGGGGESIFSFQGIEEGGGDFKGEKGWKRRGVTLSYYRPILG